MVKKLLLTLVAVFLLGSFASAQGIKGKVTDQTGVALPYINVQLQKEGNDVNYTMTDAEGNYQLHGVSIGTYDLVFDAEMGQCGKKKTIRDVQYTGSTLIMDAQITCGAEDLDLGIEIIYVRPLIDQDNTKTTTILDANAVRQQPGHDVTGAISTAAGVTAIDGKMQSVRGNRDDGQKTMIDGVIVRGTGGVSMASIEQVELIQGGIPAEYGDGNSFTIITTKGISKDLHGSVELMGSLEGYNNFLGSVSLTGPLAKPKAQGQPARVGFLLTGDVSYDKDGTPARGGTWRANDETIDYLIQHPYRYSTTEFGAHYSNAEYLHEENFHKQRVRDNAGNFNYLLQGKLDFLFGETNNISLSIGGMYEFTRYKNWSDNYYALFNAHNNSQSQINTWRVNARLQHRIPLKSDSSAIKNIMYNINVNYTHYDTWTRDVNHKDNLFNYGHIGYFKSTKAMAFQRGDITIDSIRYYDMNILANIYDSIVEFSPIPFGSNDQSLNTNPDLTPYVTTFTDTYSPETIYEYFGVIPYNKTLYQQFGALLNGDSPDAVYSLFQAPGTVRGSYSKSAEDQIGANASLSLTIKNHDFKLGYIFEKRTSRSFGVSPYGLWTLMRSSANYHISELDTDHPYIVGDDTVMYDRYFDAEAQTTFDRNLRKSLGLDPDGKDWIDIDNMSPDQFSLSMFSPEELFNGGSTYISYYGYDYTGTKKYTKKTDINDFFNKTDKYGDKLYNVGAYEPIYMAMYIQDKFSINTMMFNIGLRVDRFDANQYVLNDPYLFREAYKVGEVRDVYDVASNAEDDWVVYVNQLDKTLDPDNASIVAYRKGHNWYDSEGAVVTDPSTVLGATGGPILKNELNETAVSKVEGSAFSKYEPQWSVMPRLSFSFNVSDKSLFYAHYNIITVRPSDLRLDPISYLWVEKLGSNQNNVINNPSLKPSKSIDYEIGFRQAIGENSAISLSAYYSEKRDQVQCYRYTGAYPSTYYSYDNIDFGTVQGFTVGYDLRRTRNVTLRASYTLQFAKGTGSSETSSLAIIASGQPNLRTLTNLSFDQRHKLSANIDYRFGMGTDYKGPTSTKVSKDGSTSREIRWLENFGVNINFSAGSGLPYSRSSKPYSSILGVGKSQLTGTINGSNMPWIFQCDIRVDKTFVLNLKKDEETGKPTKQAFLNVYLDVMNLFNFKNVIYVYQYTGNADDDGYLTANEYQQQINSQVDVAAYTWYYRMRVANPYNYTMPTRVRLGVNFSF
ncbi:MAG: TonB-dependent receptor [Bacteroidales bacterium]|nr:TonB-dependent receptor [Bacteroidales bacterium]